MKNCQNNKDKQMKFAEIVIKPVSAFGTPLKGDTIFGHFYWQLIYDPSLVKGDLLHLRDTYGHEPFVIFSSAFPRLKDGWLLPRPALPLSYFRRPEQGDCFESIRTRKDEKKKKWMVVKEFKINLKTTSFLNEEEAAKMLLAYYSKDIFDVPQKIIVRSPQPHNTINRLAFTTGMGSTPYQLENIWFLPGIRLSIFVLYWEKVLNLENIYKAFTRIGLIGFGRDASSGLGRFEVEDVLEHPLPAKAQVLYTLGPYVPQKGECEKIWFQPFVRFGRHGSYLVYTGRPFKNPVLMADEGAVLMSTSPKGPYLGRALTNLSKTEKNTIGQGFSIVFPVEGLE